MRLEQKATIVSTTVAAILVTIKMTVGILSGSVAVLASAIDSFLDLAVSLFNYFALKTAHKAPDDKFNYGRSKMEPLAAVIEGTIISLSGVFVFYEAMVKFTHARETTYIVESIYVMITSILITVVLVYFLHYVAQKTGSLIIKTDALHYKTDLFSNGTVLIALGLISFTGIELIDPILGVAIAFYMIYSSYPLIKEGILMLLDVAIDEEDFKKIESVFEATDNITSFHNLRTRNSASEYFISAHVVFNVSISLYDAHKISDTLEDKLKGLFEDKTVHVLIHMDPYDDSELNDI